MNPVPRKIKSLRKKLTVRVLLIALVILLVAVVSTQLSTNNSFWSATEQSIRKSTEIAARDISMIFAEAEALLQVTANNIRFIDHTDQELIQNFLYSSREPFNFISEIYIGISETNQYADGAGYVPPPEWVLTSRPYYIGAMATSGIFYADPYLATTGDIFSSLAMQMKDQQGVTIGVTVIDLALGTLLDLAHGASIPGTTASGFLLDSNMRILAHQNSDFMPHVQSGEAVYVSFSSIGIEELEVISEGIGNETRLIRATDYDGIEKYISTAVLPGTGWTFGFAVPVSDFAAQLNTTESLMIYVVIIVVAIVGIFFATQILLIRPIKPIDNIVKTAHMLAVGKTPDQINVVSDDELGVLSEDFNRFIESTKEQVSVLSKMADGNLMSEVTPKSPDDLLSNAINSMAENVRQLVSRINSTSIQVSGGAKQVAEGATMLAQGATEQAASIQELSSSISRIASKTRENAHTAEKTSALSADIKESAERGNHQMDEMMTAVSDINEASKNIGKIIKTIDDIAFQTNILALNAAVEAARAGQHGKGFAVVAEEVRNLASKSAEAAKDTGDLIQNSIEKAELGSRIAEETATSLGEIVAGINETSQLVAEIAKASEEQSDGITEINTGIDQVAQVVQQNSATAEQSAAASEEMSDQSDMLEQLIAQFKIGDNTDFDNSLGSLPPQASNRLLQSNQWKY